jgi:ParB family chromosome partitioning protein
MGATKREHFKHLQIDKTADRQAMPDLAVVRRDDQVGFPDIVLAEVSAAMSGEEPPMVEAPTSAATAARQPEVDTSISTQPLGNAEPVKSSAGGWASKMKSAKAVGSVATALGDLRDHNNAEIAALKRQLSEGQTVLELETDKIDSSFVSDRMDNSDGAIEELRELIRSQGQLVPILVRPHPEQTDRYQVAFGHRRLRAIRQLGRKVRAVVRQMTDEELIIAQGQENNARLDLTYIEKARFASTLLEMKFKRKAVEEALNVNHSQVVWFKQVTDAIPDEVLTAIGRAPKIGRPRWLQLADLISKAGNAKRSMAISRSEKFLELDSDERFSFLAKELAEAKAAAPDPKVWTDPKGRKLASFTYSETKCTVQIDRRDDPDFATYLFSKLGDIYREYEAGKVATV